MVREGCVTDEVHQVVNRVMHISCSSPAPPLPCPSPPYSVYVVYYEQYLTMAVDTLINLGCSFGAVTIVTFLFMRFSLGSTLVVIVTIAIIIVDMFGMMAVLDISLNAISLVNLVMVRRQYLYGKQCK